MQAVEFLKSFRNLDEVGQNLGPGLGRLRPQNFLDDPEGDVVEPPGEGHHIRRHLQLVLLVPRAAGQLVRADGFEQLNVK